LIREGLIEERDIDRGVRRVLKLKLRYGLLSSFPSLSPEVSPLPARETSLPAREPPR
jgi:hypothetical protein